ncbi:hypothetical protein NDU88_001006 [Pleurodeles waltl]|uniref:Uncharacterized protein n=1 Tax=Pleurodeles waltl TaxID=8319 RepID=A0AAV7NIV4_PLEWA|nr:hypothetical protein NDU88_001006 [Pleurodeles waltl]
MSRALLSCRERDKKQRQSRSQNEAVFRSRPERDLIVLLLARGQRRHDLSQMVTVITLRPEETGAAVLYVSATVPANTASKSEKKVIRINTWLPRPTSSI